MGYLVVGVAANIICFLVLWGLSFQAVRRIRRNHIQYNVFRQGLFGFALWTFADGLVHVTEAGHLILHGVSGIEWHLFVIAPVILEMIINIVGAFLIYKSEAEFEALNEIKEELEV